MRIALIHALAESAAPIARAFAELWPEAVLANLLDDSLSRDLAAEGAITPAMVSRFIALSRYAAGCGARGILFTCSAFGPAIEAARAAVSPLPVLKPTEAMIEDAARFRRVGLIASFPPTLESLPAEFPPGVSVRPRLAEGALAALQAGDPARHDEAAVAAARHLAAEGVEAIALAQFSLARAAAPVAEATGLPVLTTPGSAVGKLRALLGA
ncbi:MAG: aspartate/glutamate racemase family protein [Acetobacteraceae bacterium]|nr:aspartate/glutamate racemase family protein [Acetobacteraceae bacterium]